MAAEVHSLPEQGGERSVYLDAYLAPFRRWLERDTVTEIIVNRPGEVWIEDAETPGMQRVADFAFGPALARRRSLATDRQYQAADSLLRATNFSGELVRRQPVPAPAPNGAV